MIFIELQLHGKLLAARNFIVKNKVKHMRHYSYVASTTVQDKLQRKQRIKRVTNQATDYVTQNLPQN